MLLAHEIVVAVDVVINSCYEPIYSEARCRSHLFFMCLQKLSMQVLSQRRALLDMDQLILYFLEVVPIGACCVGGALI